MRRLFLILLVQSLLTLAVLAQTPTPAPETPVPATPAPTVTATPTPTGTVTPVAATATPPVPLPVLLPALTPTPTPSASSSPVKRPLDDLESASLASPRASLERFMDLMSEAGPLRPDIYILARRHLDLSGIATLVRDEAGVTLCQQLYDILKAAEVDATKLDNFSGQSQMTLYRQPSGNAVELVCDSEGRWRFSADTVSVIPQMYKVLTSKGKIEMWGLDSLNFDLLGVNCNVWLALLLLPCFAYGVGVFFVFLVRVSIGKLLLKLGVAGRSQKTVLRPLGWLMASLVLWIGISALDLPSWLLLILTASVKVLATFSSVIAAFRVSDAASVYAKSFTAQTTTKFDDMLIPLARRTFKGLVGVLGLLFLAQNLDIEVWSLFAGFSIFGAMVALAGQDMVKNFFGSVTVLIDQPFSVDDWIVVEGIEGVVEDVGFRSTRIRTFYDSVISLPNSRLITASVDNYGRRKYRRYTRKLQVRWTTSPENLEAFCEGMRELVRLHPYTRKDNYQIWVNDVSEYALEILLYIFFAAPDWTTELRERHRFLLDVHRLAARLGIEFAYPSQRLLIARQEEGFEEQYSRESQDQALEEGREATRELLGKSLPSEKPPRAVID